jgi:hypothetical protein
VTYAVDLVKYANDVTQGTFMSMFFVAFFFIVFMGLKIRGYDTDNCFYSTFFVTFTLSVFLYSAGLIPILLMLGPGICLALLTVWMFGFKNKY